MCIVGAWLAEHQHSSYLVVDVLKTSLYNTIDIYPKCGRQKTPLALVHRNSNNRYFQTSSSESTTTTIIMNKQQQQLHELSVTKTELTAGDTSGLVYVRSSNSNNTSATKTNGGNNTTAFLVTPRQDVIREVDEKLRKIEHQQ